MAMLAGIKTGSKSMTRKLVQEGLLWKVKRTLKIDYVVIAGAMNEPSEMIALAPGVPRLGAVYPDPAGWFIVKAVDPQQSKAVTVDGKQTMEWIVSVEMDSEIEAVDPVELPPEVSWGSETQQCQMTVDVKNKKVETVPGEPINLTKTVTIPVLTIRRFYRAENFSPEIIYSYTNTLNQKTFWNAPPHHALLTSIQGKYSKIELPDGTKPLFFQATYTIKFRRELNSVEPWLAEILHCGNKYKDKDGHIIQAVSHPGNNPTQVKLDPEGKKLPNTAESHYLKFNVYEEQDFTPLAINNTDIFR